MAKLAFIKSAVLWVAVSGLMLMAGCQSNGNAPATVQSVAFNVTQLQVAPNSKTQLFLNATDSAKQTSDVTHSAKYSVDDTAVATIDTNGVVTAVGVGTTTINASYADQVAHVPVTVSAKLLSLKLSAQNVTMIALNTTTQLSVQGVYEGGYVADLTQKVQYTIDNAAVATVSNTGLITSHAFGNAVVHVSVTDHSQTIAVDSTIAVVSQLVSITTVPNAVVVALGRTPIIFVVGRYSNGTTQVLSSYLVFNSSDPTVATADAGGNVTTLKVGTTTMTVVATDPNTYSSLTQTVPVTVTPAALTDVQLQPNPVALALGKTQQLKVVGVLTNNVQVDLTASSTYTPSNATLMSVNASGLATALKAGTGTIRVRGTYAPTSNGYDKSFPFQVICCQGSAAFEMMSTDFTVSSSNATNDNVIVTSIENGTVTALLNGWTLNQAEGNNFVVSNSAWGLAASPTSNATLFGMVLSAPVDGDANPIPVIIRSSDEIIVRAGLNNVTHVSALTVIMDNSALNSTNTDYCSADITSLKTDFTDDYVIPFSAFTCSSDNASLATSADIINDLRASGIGQVTVEIDVSKNPKLTTSDKLEMVVEFVGFNHTVGNSAVTAATDVSAFEMFASNIRVPAGLPAGVLAKGIQGGSVSAVFSAKYHDGCYKSSDSDTLSNGYFTYRVVTASAASCPHTGGSITNHDSAALEISSPTLDGTTATGVNIGLANNFVIRAGNTAIGDGTGGYSNVMTVQLNNGHDAVAATDVCSADITMQTGRQATELARQSVIIHSVPLSNFSCSVGSMADLQATGVFEVRLQYLTSKNPTGTAVDGLFDNFDVAWVAFSQ